MSNSVNLSLDVTKTGIQNPLIKVRQGDGGLETLHTTVTSNGEPLDLQGWTITFMGTTAGNHKIVDGNVTIVEAPNGVFDYTPSKAWGMDIGEFKTAYFKFVKGDGSASSANFRVSVIEAVDLTQEEAQNYIAVVDVLIETTNQKLTNSLASVSASIAATSSAASSMANTASNAINDVNSIASSAISGVNSTASSAFNNVNSVASSAVIQVNSAASSVSSVASSAVSQIGDVATLEKTYKDEMDKWVKYIQDLPDGSPAGVYANLAALKAANPDHSRIYVTTDNNSWNYWDGSTWVVGGIYQGGVVSDSEIERIIMTASSTTNGQNVEAISAISSNGRTGGNSFYIIGKVFTPDFLSRVAFYTFKAGTANVGIFSTDVTDISVDGVVALKLLSYKTISTHVGFNFVDFNLDMKKNYLIGISTDGISFMTGTSYRSFQTTSFSPTIGNDYSLNFSLGAGLGLSVFAMTKPAMRPALLYAKNAIKPMTLISQNNDPIIFDMTTNKVTVSGLLGVVGHHADKAIDYIPLNGVYDMPSADKTQDLPVNYYMFYNLETEKVTINSSMGGLSPYNIIDIEKMLFVGGFSVRNLSQQKSSVDIFSTNNDYIKVIVNRANGTVNSFEDIVTLKNQQSKTYNKTYVAVGDSITEGEDPNNSYAPAIGHRYSDWVGRELGVKAINMGVGGSTVRNNGVNSVYSRITKVPKADFVSIMAGTNDFGTNTPLGNYGGDVTKEFRAAYDSVVRYMMTRDEQLIIITPLNRKQKTNTIGLSLKDYVDVELEVAKKYGVPVIDLYNTYQYHTAYENFYAKYMPDGLHPSADGYDLMSKRIVAGIKQLVNV